MPWIPELFSAPALERIRSESTVPWPGSADRLLLAVTDIDAARDDLIRRDVDVGEVLCAKFGLD